MKSAATRPRGAADSPVTWNRCARRRSARWGRASRARFRASGRLAAIVGGALDGDVCRAKGGDAHPASCDLVCKIGEDVLSQGDSCVEQYLDGRGIHGLPVVTDLPAASLERKPL